jgi:hypothetical protein
MMAQVPVKLNFTSQVINVGDNYTAGATVTCEALAFSFAGSFANPNTTVEIVTPGDYTFVIQPTDLNGVAVGPATTQVFTAAAPQTITVNVFDSVTIG